MASEFQSTAGEEGHGLYDRHFDPHELADLVAHALEDSLVDEIAAMRVVLSRGLEQFERQLTAKEHIRLADQLSKEANTISKLMRAQRAISGEAADGYSEAMDRALDILSDDWGINL